MTKNKRLIIIFSAVVLLAVLIIINSVIFSIRNVNGNVINYPNNHEEAVRINDLLREHHGIRLGSSIFTLNEERATSALRERLLDIEELAHIEILSLERIFPRSVVIHYIILRPFFYVMQGGRAYIFSNNHTLVHIESSQQAAHARGAVGLRLSGTLLSRELGELFNSSAASDVERFAIVLDAFIRIPFNELRFDFSYVDISNTGAVFIRMAPVPRVRLEFRSLQNFNRYFQHAFSAYRYFLLNVDHFYRTQSGTIHVFTSERYGPVTTWRPD